jgi:hypothetical protein
MKVKKMNEETKAILSIFLIISALLMLVPEIITYGNTPDNKLTIDAKNQLLFQMIGLFLLFLVVSCVIWAIPETTTGKPTTRERRTVKEQIDSKEEHLQEMLENGYVLNMESGKWEKPTDT